MKRLEGTTQFVEIAAKGKTVVSTTGEIGTAGETETTQHHNRAVAARTVMRRVAEYKAHGYRTVQVAPPVHPRDAILEAALRVDRDDPAPYQVYADWLQTQGSSIGKLIIFDLAKRREVADELRDKVVALDPDLATIEWKWGLWRSLRIDNADDPTNEQFDGAAMARPLFAHTLCGALEELRVGVLRWDHGQDDVPRFVEQAGMFPWAADLRSLHLGDVDPDVDMAHHAIGKVGKAVSRAFPRLVALRVHSGDQAWRGVGDTFGLESLALPDLSSLVIETCSLTRERLAAVLDAALPSLATLELWFGSEAQHCPSGNHGYGLSF